MKLRMMTISQKKNGKRQIENKTSNSEIPLKPKGLNLTHLRGWLIAPERRLKQLL